MKKKHLPHRHVGIIFSLHEPSGQSKGYTPSKLARSPSFHGHVPNFLIEVQSLLVEKHLHQPYPQLGFPTRETSGSGSTVVLFFLSFPSRSSRSGIRCLNLQ